MPQAADFFVNILPETVWHVELPNGEGFTVDCYDRDGRHYWHHRMDLTATQAINLAVRVKEVGRVNLQHWYSRAVYGSRSWEIDGEEERQIADERMAEGLPYM